VERASPETDLIGETDDTALHSVCCSRHGYSYHVPLIHADLVLTIGIDVRRTSELCQQREASYGEPNGQVPISS
jgi:hypothetical protein